LVDEEGNILLVAKREPTKQTRLIVFVLKKFKQ
jgi:hypothetical protein